MGLCLIDVHGDIEGDFEWVEDLPKNRKEFLIAIEELEKIKAEIGEAYPYFDSADVHWGFNICRDIIDKHISELKGGAE